VYSTLRIDADPTSWELTEAIEKVPTFSAPEVLGVYHPLWGELVLSQRAMGSAVFLEFGLDVFGTRPNGMPMPGQFLYVPSPTGPNVHSIPPNLYILPDTADLAVLKADIIAAMTHGTSLRVKFQGGVVIINGDVVPFAVLGPAHS
jgi:hypothetical protein